tara:strand:- start:1043 stop:1702 length:660 start_codon:yes stop_codon:yes gene_type:complete
VLVPLAIVIMIEKHSGFLSETIDRPDFLYYASGCLILGSLFEIIQNTKDRWYITAETASGKEYGLFDGLFTFFILVGQAFILIALLGNTNWILWTAVLAILTTPIFYIKEQFVFLPTSVIGLLNVIIGFYIFSDPIIFLQLATVVMTLFFFNLLIRTKAQSFHGLTTLSASSGIWFLILSVDNAAEGQLSNWLIVVSILIGLSFIFLLNWKWLNQIGET